ncbi:MBL fold metallo-hydrolase [Roseateles cellulosilyticus]|uniref:MBL fold metallo-hydrolase n=1 Tax=Pelomonas cellulosilytica TaxID=2906762 RepID=A0ABS8XU05_9BURK|nr:MBL fold metallo-hydrolase [Pelomonas sp. P8]MCE4554091.1 MBL fold metallo-hydrolase [Pelomonas sp. P8]
MSRPRHHRQGGFQNNYGDFEAKSLADVLRWRWTATRQGLPKRPVEPIPTMAPDLAFLQANRGTAQQPAVTWIGHATVLAQLGGLSLLTDPIFSERASPLSFVGPRREQPPGVALAALPHVDLVLVSHNHYDHLDLPTCRALAAQAGGSPLFVVPLGLQRWFQTRGIARVVELDWWQGHHHDGVDVQLVPAQHWSARGIHDRMKTLWGGFAVFAPECHLFFAGDTGYSRDFADIRERLSHRQADGGFDIALIPIGAYEPRWFMKEQHVNVEEALNIHADLGAKRSLGVHWGTFELTDEPLDEPPRQLRRQRAERGGTENDFFTLAIGETRRIPPRR